VTSILDGGRGNDALRADSNALGFSVRALNSLQGGAGNDQLIARVDSVASLHFLNTSNVLNVGTGNDSLEASLSAVARPGEQARAENHLNGGAGNDRLLATVAAGSIGTSFLNGGTGNDQLTVIGGSDNVLNGGSGRDSFVGSTGNDRFIGGQGADTYSINPTLPEGADTFADFSLANDRFSVVGLADQGTSGLVDDLDAVSTFNDLGLGNDVIVSFNAGSELTLKEVGTGAVDSWAKLVADPSTQLVIGSS